MALIRDVSRLARRVPVIRAAVEATDPRRRAEMLVRTGIIDTSLYAAQLGLESITVQEAAHHYAAEGYLMGYTLNVLVDPFVLKRGMLRTGRPALYDYFNSAAWHLPTTGTWDAVDYAVQFPAALSHAMGPVGHLWERVTADPSTTVRVTAGGTREFAWSEIYPVLAEATAEWATMQRSKEARIPHSDLNHAPSLSESVIDQDDLVSIIMPVWNRGGSMRTAVDSILAQTWRHWELLIIDDGSWDDTLAVAELLASRDSRIKLIRRSHSGVCAARNAGIAEASGNFIAFLDSDNTWLPSFLHDMVVTMRRRQLSVAYATVAIDDGERVRYRYGRQTRESLLLGNSIDLNTLVAHADAIREVEGFDVSLRRAVDYDLILKLSEQQPIEHVPTLGARYDNALDTSDRISTSEAYGWNTSVRLRHSIVDPSAHAPATVVGVIQRHDPELSSKLNTLRALSDENDIAISAVGVKPDEWRQIRVCSYARPRMQSRLYQAGEAFAYVVNLELRRSQSDVFCVLDPRSLFTERDVSTLLDEVASGKASAAIPMTLGLDGTIDSVGSMLAGPQHTPIAILGGHPAEDARRLGERIELTGLSGRTVAVSRELFARVGGLDPLLHNEYELSGLADVLSGQRLVARTDVVLMQVASALEFDSVDTVGTSSALRLRLAEAKAAAPDAVYAKLDMHVPHWRRHTPLGIDVETPMITPRERLVPVVVRDRRTVTVDGRSVPRLRWAIKTASPAGPTGEAWGDTHFGRSLAAALTALGQEAVVDAFEAHHRRTEYLDDVVIQLRGLKDFVPSRGSLSYLWIISHPDLVSRAECARFDRVFAASLSWATQASERWAIPVEPLLQCTDPSLFFPVEGEARDGSALFVGKSRGVPRPTVMESVRSGIPFELYGPDWDRFVPADAITGTGIANHKLGRVYGRAAVVLNDHWSDMQREGFISNRLFDVVAAGGRAFSDAVAGIPEVFGGAVQTYNSVSEIVPFLSGDLDARFPDEEALGAIGTRIRAEHSFAARARVLLDRAIADVERLGLR
ncbi:glycosyltransferase [Microbacterium sp. YJN-G]|uniref:glycosyltransferase n=1 Tax=Microbacterium sp. YJN-G TaxID=2763257 RepID=UPI001877E131|nr:glycosyltransferase [Microbacterium sp. YJN-G]